MTTGPEAAKQYLKRHPFGACLETNAIDTDIASLIEDRSIHWNETTDQFYSAELGDLFSFSGTLQ